MPEPVKSVVMKIGYLVQSTEEAFKAQINGAAVTLLAEMYGDHREERYPAGGILFNFPTDHKHRDVWIAITHQAPAITAEDPTAPRCGRNAVAAMSDGVATDWAPCVRSEGHRGLCHAADPEE